jgi:outer membrane protein TolC
LEAAQNDYYNAKNKLDLSEKNVFQAQYALKLANARYKNGVITQVEIEATQTALREAQLTQLQYQYQMTQAKLELNRLTGIKFW